ncbi:MAG: arsenite methyltransferase [Candidatus Thermoplasmatota archaeon]|nr:arsenite methyltransferase [Candidatus Thermoplasmatota archaeon]
MKDDEVKKAVKEGYAKIAKKSCSCCGPTVDACGTPRGSQVSKGVGYTDEELKAIPEDADMGLGCGNPVALSTLREGETVLDLGSGGGIDCFLAAGRVGEKGRVIGVDMTAEMVEKARENAKRGGFENVEFRLGDIEDIPVDDGSVDVIISNCVINLSPDKGKVFREAFRVLTPGGRMFVSDIVLLKELPEAVKADMGAYVGCLSGAVLREDYIGLIERAGFQDVSIRTESSCSMEVLSNDPTVSAMMSSFDLSREEAEEAIRSVISVIVEGTKPV